MRRVALACVAASVAALLLALLVQDGLGVVPCELCLLERWPYRAVAVLGVLALLLDGGAARTMLWAALAVLVASCLLAFLHAGVEWGFWPSPFPSCRAPTFAGGSIAERLARMPARPQKPCDAPTDLIAGLPLSMAAMNLVFSLLLAAFLAISLARSQERARR